MEVYSGLSQVQASQALCLQDGLGFHPPPSAAPAALCPLASCGLLWRALRCALAPSEWWNRWCSCSLAESCPTLCDPSHSSPPGSSVHGISTLLCQKPIEAVQLPPWLLPGSLCPAGSITCSVRTQRGRILPCGWRMENQMGNAAKRGEYSQKLPRTAVWVLSVGWLPQDKNAQSCVLALTQSQVQSEFKHRGTLLSHTYVIQPLSKAEF